MSDLDNFKDSEYPGKLMVITAYEYDILGNRTKVISPLAFGYKEDDIQNRANYTNEYSYDILNRLEKITRKYGSRDVFTQYTYDAAGNQLTVMNERGYTTWYTYDKLNRVETITDPKNNQYSYTYDLAGNRLTETNAKGYTMTYEYDALNRLQTVTDAYNKVISRKVYDANGNVIKEIDAEGYQSANDDESRFGTIYTYNLGNLLVSISTPEAADKKKISNKFTYNQYGEVTKQTDALDCTTSYEYDAAGNMTKVTDALGTTTKYSYDKQGNKLTMTDGRGKLTSYAYSDFGKLKSVTNADNKTQSYKYDLEGNTACVTDKNGNNTVYAYDNRGLLLERKVLISGNSSANSSDIVSYTYDEAGNRASMTDEIGTSEYSYDENNRLIEIQKNGATQISYAYDQIGNVTKVTDLKGYEVGYTYDKSSRMETVTYGGKTTTYSYDDNGRRSSVTYAGGVSENYTFDKDNRLIKLTNVKPNGGIISEYSYTYDLVGRQLTKTDLYGITSYEYDIIGRISKVATPGKTTIYSYDKVGNRLLQQETYTSLQPSDYVDETTGKEIQYILKKSDYTYSNTNQLLKLVERMFDESNKEIARKTTKYTYDNNGNQLKQSISHTLPDNTGLRPKTTGTAYGDKLSDNSEKIDKMLEKTSYTYDGFNRLKNTETIKDGIRTTVDFIYNGDDLRVSKTTRKSNNNYTPEVTNYLYDRQNVILETDANSNVKARYIKGINYIAKTDAQSNTAYFLFNGHGDVVQTVDESGTVQNQYDYDIWGNPVLTIETTQNSIRYTGEFYDEETGLYYLRARYYDPYLGRFTTEDSYWGEDGNPLSLNLYTYCENDPIQFTDPTGHSIFSDIIKTIGDAVKEFVNNVTGGIKNSSGGNSGKSSGSSSGAGSSSNSSGGGSSSSSSGGNSSNSSSSSSSGASSAVGAVFAGFFGFVGAALPQISVGTTLIEMTKRFIADTAVKQSQNPKYIENFSLENMKLYWITGIEVSQFQVGQNLLFASASTVVSDVNYGIKFPDADLTINGKKIDGIVSYVNGITYANIEKVAKAIDPTAIIDTKKHTLTITDKNTGKKVTISTVKSDGNPIGVGDIAKAAGVDDTISYWNDKNGDHFVVINSDMKYAPVMVIRKNDNVYITAYIDYNLDGTKLFQGSKKTYAEAVTEYLEKAWSGNFNVYGQQLTVSTTIYSNDLSPNKILKKPTNISKKQEWLEFNLLLGDKHPTSYFMSPNEGLTTYGVIEGVAEVIIPGPLPYQGENILDWSIKHSSTPIDVYDYGNTTQDGFDYLLATCVHEFGHALGLGDAYNAGYRGGSSAIEVDGYWAPETYTEKESGYKETVTVPDNDIMIEYGDWDKMIVTDNDIRMMLEAYRRAKPSFFPQSSKNFNDRKKNNIYYYKVVK